MSWSIFFFLMNSYVIFLLLTYYHGERGSVSSKQNFALNCTIPPEVILPQNYSTTAPQEQSSWIILLWTWPAGRNFSLNQCPPSIDSSGCFFTVDRSMYSMSDAVVIHHRDVSWSLSLLPPTPRPSKQFWIWFNLESPSNTQNLTMMDNIINMTMSYRVDSDIFSPYGWLEKRDEKENFTIPQKTRLVAWAVSNWKTQLRRFQYYEELKPHIQIDIYGKQHLPLPKSYSQLRTFSQYKFYLSFENSIHEDYITEKLWSNAFLSGTVPVVMGPPRKNYERFIPPDSFIHVDDFSSAQELASYLLSLDGDDEKYEQYFNWRNTYQPVKDRKMWITDYCKVCKTLKEAPLYRTIPSIAEWFK
ncbi:3-galactosyl-N-acetylglucosaminide 4-alpha-L-fucosyltransferase FUT3-like [Dendropsophus ebraccatus]|uniref:3-galactosyl-N-acetylglucosaminide 4-alpha-L-fucosyltransferase FUT3-like n=1 Tax=Dendropsophus ebraccatus TaxID=150705 RepID=UPI003831645D